MPWLTIIMALVSFLMSKKAGVSTAGSAAIAAGVGAATYGVTHYTDILPDSVREFDGYDITVDSDGRETIAKPDGTTVRDNGDGTAEVKDPDGKTSTVKLPSTSETGNSGAWNALKEWLTSPAGQVTTGAAGAKALGMPKWLIWGGVGVAAFLILK